MPVAAPPPANKTWPSAAAPARLARAYESVSVLQLPAACAPKAKTGIRIINTTVAVFLMASLLVGSVLSLGRALSAGRLFIHRSATCSPANKKGERPLRTDLPRLVPHLRMSPWPRDPPERFCPGVSHLLLRP